MINLNSKTGGSFLKKIKAQKAHCVTMGFLCVSLLSFPQSIKQEFTTASSAEKFDTITINHLIEKYQADQDSLTPIFYQIGYNFLQVENEKALYFFRKCAETKPNNDPEQFACRSRINIGFTYSQMGKFEEAKKHYQNYTNSQCDTKQYFVLYELAKLYIKSGDHHSAVTFLQEMHKIPHEKIDNFRLIMSYFTLGNAYAELSQPERAIQAYDESERLYEKVDFDDLGELNKILTARAQEYEKINDFKGAENDYLESIRIAKNNNYWENYFHAKDQLGLLYTKANRHPEAIQQFNEVIRQQDHPENIRLYSAYSNKADLHVKMGSEIKAMQEYEKAIQLFFKRSDISPASENFYQQLSSSPNRLQLLQIIPNYIHTISMSNNKDAGKVEELLEMTTAIAKGNLNLTSRASIYEWRKKLKPIYEEGIAFYVSQNEVEKCFDLIEQSKAIVLLQELQQNYLFADDERGNELRAHLLEKEAAFETAEPGTIKSNLLLEIDRIKDSISTYLESKSQQDPFHIVSLQDVQKQLSENESLINYFWGENHLYSVLVNADQAVIHQTSLTEKDQEEVQVLIRNMRESSATNRIDSSQSQSPTIWDKIVVPSKKEKRIILPDGLLNFLPFEAFNSQENHLESQPVISYGFSASTYFFSSPVTINSKEGVLAFAPIHYEEALHLSDLNQSENELTAIKNYMHDDLIGKMATKANLLKNSPKHSLLHLSTHGAASDEGNEIPWIAAQDAKIYLPEVYQMKLQADLVVLSACETNLGKQIQGEGVLNLSRGFIQAGAQSVISSLWQVNEKSTAEIMNSFYENLHQGHTKAKALQLAKQQYRENYPEFADDPYYWAGLVYYGEDGNLQLPQKQPAWQWLLLGLVTISIFAFISKRI